MAKVPSLALAGIRGLEASVQADASQSTRQIGDTAKRLELIISKIHGIGSSSVLLEAYPDSVSDSLSTVRADLVDLETSSVDELVDTSSLLLSQRRAEAAENVMAAYQSLKRLVEQTEVKTDRLLKYTPASASV